MKRYAIGLALLAVVLSGCGEQQWIDHRGDPLYATELQDRWVVVNYWAEWCAPCRDELPELNELARVSADLIVLGIHFDGYQGDELHRLSEEMGIQFPVLGQDFAEAHGLPLPQILPTTYIINPRGTLVQSLQGPRTEQELLALMELEGAEND